VSLTPGISKMILPEAPEAPLRGADESPATSSSAQEPVMVAGASFWAHVHQLLVNVPPAAVA